MPAVHGSVACRNAPAPRRLSLPHTTRAPLPPGCRDHRPPRRPSSSGPMHPDGSPCSQSFAPGSLALSRHTYRTQHTLLTCPYPDTYPFHVFHVVGPRAIRGRSRHPALLPPGGAGPPLALMPWSFPAGLSLHRARSPVLLPAHPPPFRTLTLPPIRLGARSAPGTTSGFAHWTSRPEGTRSI